MASTATATPMSWPTPAPTPCWARRPWATWAPTSPTPILSGPGPTAWRCCTPPRSGSGPRAGSRSTWTARSCSRRPKVAPHRVEMEERLSVRGRRPGVGQGQSGRGARSHRARRGHRLLRRGPARGAMSPAGESPKRAPSRGGGAKASARSRPKATARRGSPAKGRPQAGSRPARTVGRGREGHRQPPGPPRGRLGAQGRPPRGAGPDRARLAPSRRAAAHGDAPGPKGLGGDQVEGRQAVRELLLAGTRRVREVWIAADQDDSVVLDDIAELALSVGVPGAGRDPHQAGVGGAHRVAAGRARPWPASLPEVELDDLLAGIGHGVHPFLLVVDGVTDPGNLGALLRSADGAGATGIVLPRHRAVHITPTVAKAAAGAIEHLPMALVGGLPARHPAPAGRRRVGGRSRRLGPPPTVRPRPVRSTGGAGARGRGHRPVAAGARALRRGGVHPAGRPAGLAQRGRGRRRGLLRGRQIGGAT